MDRSKVLDERNRGWDSLGTFPARSVPEQRRGQELEERLRGSGPIRPPVPGSLPDTEPVDLGGKRR